MLPNEVSFFLYAVGNCVSVVECRVLRTLSCAPFVLELGVSPLAAAAHVPLPLRLPPLPSARSLRRTHGTWRQLRSLFPSDGPPLAETYPMAETRLQARKRVSDPLCQAARPGPQLLARTLGSYARSGNVAIVQSLIPCRHMSELPHPIVVDCTITLSATQVYQPWCRPPGTWCDALPYAVRRCTMCSVLASAPLRRVDTIPASRS